MILQRKKICLGKAVLASSFLLVACFSYWLIPKSDDEKVHRVFVEHDRLVLQGKRKEAHALFTNALLAEEDGPLDPIWLPLVRTQGSGYVQLGYYIRILEGDPDREATYEEIANLIEIAPESFHKEVKPIFLSDIAVVPGIRFELLEKYGLRTSNNK